MQNICHFPSSLEVVHAQPDSDLGVLQQYVLKHGGVAILGQVLPGVIKVSETTIIDSRSLVTFSVWTAPVIIVLPVGQSGEHLRVQLCRVLGPLLLRVRLQAVTVSGWKQST